MAVLTAKGISSVALELLSRTLVLPRTVTMVPSREFAGRNGDTITVPVPQPGSARTEAPGQTLTSADVDEVPVDVQLGHLYHLKDIGDDEASMDLETFTRQVTRIQTDAVAIGAEDKITTAMNGLPASSLEFAATATSDDTRSIVLQARQALSEADAPAGGRFLAVAPSIHTRLLSVPDFVKVNEAGSSDALRQAIVGRIFGMTVVESNGLTTDTAVAYHRSGFAFANRIPISLNAFGIVQPGADSASVSEQGVGMRFVLQYNSGSAQFQSLVSTFAGASAVADDDSPSADAHYPRSIKLTVGS